METVENRVNQNETAVLVLTGHTHRNVEYVITYRGAKEEDKVLRYYHGKLLVLSHKYNPWLD